MQKLFQCCLYKFLWFFLGFLLLLLPAQSLAAGLDGYDLALSAPVRDQAVTLPPQLPEYLPNGAVNLDQAWIQDGGARLYWNTLTIPRQLKMAGARWVDPALTPELFPAEKPKARSSKTYRARPAQAQNAAKSQAQAANAAQSTFKIPESPAIPLPLTPASPATPQSPVITPLQTPASQERVIQPTVPLPEIPQVSPNTGSAASQSR